MVVCEQAADNSYSPVSALLAAVSQPVKSLPSAAPERTTALVSCQRAYLARVPCHTSFLPVAYPCYACGHGGTQNSSTSRSVQT